jgi:uncharacterized protein
LGEILKKRTRRVSNEKAKEVLSNGLQEALFGSQNVSILGFNPGSIGTPVQQVDTLQLNLRWYLISNFRQLLNELYAEKGIIQTIVDVPVNDAFRGGIEIKSKQISEDEIAELKSAQEKYDDLGKVKQAEKWNRLFGGAGVLIITDQDPESEFKIESLKQGDCLEFRAVDMWELFWTKQNTDDYSAAIDRQDLSDVDFYNYYAEQVHKSRVLKMTGIEPPSFIRPRLRGWGLSVVETCVDALNQYLKTIDVVFEVIDEFKVDVYKIKNLANTVITSNGTQAVQRRIAMANQQKNYQNALTLDSEDDFIQKQITFSGIAETMLGVRMQIASALRMPMSKVFGIASTGFSSGEDDIENYNAMVESEIRQKLRDDVIYVTKIRCQQLFGHVPDDLTIEFKPLRILSSEQEENVKTQKFARLLSAAQAGLMTVEEFKDACNRDSLLGIQVDASIDKIEPIESKEGQEALKAPESKLKPEKVKE